ncbi:MAG: CPXCG motif-containing cysteine-rich protein [Proteobacteria bacterium]|nr:MAG: CPXCG motif-containing cysteine-rich protein [Pseudomonadota bacterium]
MLNEHRFFCPYCGQSISVIVDLSVSQQRYVEDCEICCQPIELSYWVENSRLDQFQALRADE